MESPIALFCPGEWVTAGSRTALTATICPVSEVASKMLSAIWMRVSGSLLCTEVRMLRTRGGSRPSQIVRMKSSANALVAKFLRSR